MRRVGRGETCGCAGSASGVVRGDLLAQPVLGGVRGVARGLAALVGGGLREHLAEDRSPSAAALGLAEVRFRLLRLLRLTGLAEVRLRLHALAEVRFRLLRLLTLSVQV